MKTLSSSHAAHTQCVSLWDMEDLERQIPWRDRLEPSWKCAQKTGLETHDIRECSRNQPLHLVDVLVIQETTLIVYNNNSRDLDCSLRWVFSFLYRDQDACGCKVHGNDLVKCRSLEWRCADVLLRQGRHLELADGLEGRVERSGGLRGALGRVRGTLPPSPLLLAQQLLACSGDGRVREYVPLSVSSRREVTLSCTAV